MVLILIIYFFAAPSYSLSSDKRLAAVSFWTATQDGVACA